MQLKARMSGAVGPEHLAYATRVGEAAAAKVASSVDRRTAERRFDRTLWRALAGEGLAGILVPEEWGGAGLTARHFMSALEAFVARGHDVGLAVSLNVHNLLLRYVLCEHGSDEQRRRYLPGLVAGERLLAFAVTEPEIGAHPRHLKTRAMRERDGFRLTGEKAYITNGPEADLIVVIAVTDDAGPQRAISAFLVERDFPGVTVGAPMDLGYLQTSPHAQLRLNGVLVPDGNLIGPEGDAYRTFVRMFRDHEDAFGCGLACGMLAWQLDATLGGPPGEAAAADGIVAEALATAHSALLGARACAHTIAAARDAGAIASPEEGGLIDAVHAEFQRGVDAVTAAWQVTAAPETAAFEASRHDMPVMNIAGKARAVRRRQRGAHVATRARARHE